MTTSWIQQIFDADAVNNGAVVRRSRADVDKNGGVNRLIQEARGRGYHVIETGNQIVILCHTGALQVHC